MTLEIQKFLREGGTPEQLAEIYRLKHKRHSRFPNLVLFKYDQIESPMHERICQEARGLILDESDGWRVVGRGFDKFFNYGEPNAAAIDWATARVQEKLDGSLIMCYEYGGCWNVATSGTPDASGEVQGFGFTFAELFGKTFARQMKNHGLQAPSEWCYLFELCTPYNRVVVKHAESRVSLLAVRNRKTGEYIDGEEIEGIPNVSEFPLTSFEEIIASFENIDALSQEGYVVVDGAGNRVKVKHPQYVALHHMTSNMGPKSLAKVVLTCEVPELMAAFPDFAADLDAMQVKYDSLVGQIESTLAATLGIESQKDFALAVKDLAYSRVLFAVRAGKAASVRAWLAEERNFFHALRLLGVKDDGQPVTAFAGGEGQG